jgi:hypothetical protein
MRYSRYSFLLEVDSTPRPQSGWNGINIKISITPTEIEPATFWLVQ